jgi:two-component system sensor histidine kinase MprB
VSLRWKIALALATVALVATTAVGVFGYRATSGRLVDEVDRSLRQAAVLVTVAPRGRAPDRGQLAIYDFQTIDANGVIADSTFDPELPVDEHAEEAIGSSGIVVRQTREIDGQDYRVHTYGLPGGAFQIARSLEETDRVLDDLRQRTILLIALVSLVAAAAGWLIANSVAKPLTRLTRAAEQVGTSGELVAVDVPGEGSDEVGRLGSAFRAMLAALARSRDAQHRLVQDAGHELRTPLTSLRTNLSVLRRHPEVGAETRERILDDLDSEVGELTELVNELVAAASGRLADEQPDDVRLGHVAERVAERVGRRRGRSVAVEIRSDPMVAVPPNGIERAVTNLVENACKFDESGDTVDVVVDGGSLRVLDHGPGVPEGESEMVFDRFHRSDEARSMPGSGLGLSIVRDVVEAHGGSVHATNRPDGGADIGFQLPPTP